MNKCMIMNIGEEYVTEQERVKSPKLISKNLESYLIDSENTKIRDMPITS